MESTNGALDVALVAAGSFMLGALELGVLDEDLAEFTPVLWL
jgi:hypothetical protein